MLNNGEAVVLLFPFKSPKVEFLPSSTFKTFPVSILNVLLKLVGLAEYKPTAPSPIVNLEFCPNCTWAFPSEYIPIVVPAFAPVPLLDRTIGAFMLTCPVASFT